MITEWHFCCSRQKISLVVGVCVTGTGKLLHPHLWIYIQESPSERRYILLDCKIWIHLHSHVKPSQVWADQSKESRVSSHFLHKWQVLHYLYYGKAQWTLIYIIPWDTFVLTSASFSGLMKRIVFFRSYRNKESVTKRSGRKPLSRYTSC